MNSSAAGGSSELQAQAETKIGKTNSENKCKFCGKLYSSPASLRTHEKWHTGDLKHKCSFCDKKFRNPSEVKRHEMTHTGEKPNKCPHCKMKFIQKTSLKDHIEKKHKNESPVNADMEKMNSESADLDLLELKDFSLQEYLNQSYEKVEDSFTAENGIKQEGSVKQEYDLKQEFGVKQEVDATPSNSLLTEGYKVITEAVPSNNNVVNFDQIKSEPKVTLTLASGDLLDASVVTKPFDLPTSSNSHVINIIESPANGGLSVTGQDEKMDDISIFFQELEGQYPHLKTVQIDEERKESSLQTVTYHPPRYSDISTPVDIIQVSSLSQASPPPPYHEAVTLSSNDAQTFHLIPSSSGQVRETAGPAVPPAANIQLGVENFMEQQQQQQPATVSLTFQDELNEFCEGILNQIESSDWSELSLEAQATQALNTDFSSSLTDLAQPSPSLADDSSNLSLASNQMVLTADQELLVPPVSTDDPSWVTGRSSLPSGWKMRVVDTSVGSRQIKKSHFLSPTGHYFDSRKSAIDHMIRTLAYSKDEIETMRKGLREKTKFEWSNTRQDIPAGWKTREKLSSDGKTRVFYLSPGGISFPCRLAAYEHMVKDGGYRREDIELMKIGAKNKRNKAKDFREGDPSLPRGWKIRINAQQKESFRSPAGVFFHSRQSVLDHLMQQQGTSQEDIDRVKSKIPVGKKSRRKKSPSDFQWADGDHSVPAGWKIRIVNCADGHSVTFFLTPEGATIKGRKAALQHMQKTGLYKQEDVDIMKNHLNVISKVSDIWSGGDPTLPVGWKIKKYKSKSDTTRVHCEYLSPQNQVFRSRKAVVEHMRKHGGYSEADIKIVEAGNVKNKQRTSQDNNAAFAGTSLSWVVSDSLPASWRLREEGEPGQRRTVFLSPEGKIFWSRTQVLEALIKTGASQQDISKVQKGISQEKEAKNQNNSLPDSNNGFHPSKESPILSKAFANSSLKCSTISQMGEDSKDETSSKQSVKILEEKHSQSPSSLKVKIALTGKPTILESKSVSASKGRSNEIVWKVCPSTLPAGWKTRTLYWTDREKHFYLSPEGKIFTSRKSVVLFMEQCGTYSETDFDKVKKGMNRKRKRKMKNNDQWVPVRKKSKRKATRSTAATSSVKKSNLVKEETEEEIVDEAKSEEAMEEPSDSKLASIKSCTVRIEKLDS